MGTTLSDSTWPSLPAGRALVLLPVGSTEQHGPHLPLDTDSVIAETVAHRAAKALTETETETETETGAERAPVLVAPVLAYGNSGEHAGFPGTISIGHEALRFLLVEVVRSLSLWAARVVLVNGHGGNVRTLDAAVTQLRDEGHDAAWTGCELPGADAHAGRAETSVMLHLAPRKVDLAAAAPGDTRSLSELMPELMARGVQAIAPNGVLGDPTGASAEEGRRLLDEAVHLAVRRIRAAHSDARGRLALRGPEHAPGKAASPAARTETQAR
ncbi:mycofactocin biosynthesis peptidyl-dipeptidase MftE [Streptomyces sp. NPDC050264]|uniref:mycofactocin biosynthesis peptidyl-dipeptidase MftE n=1 Tax=Streptomyces sp. NPDC050264 TaxID=3155038 RepID=UPI0034176207